MGRAHEVRAASMAKTNLAKSKLYSKYGKLIYMEARNGADPNANLKLRALIDKAKKDQVPADVIKRNIDKAKGGSQESYIDCRYEAFGPASSTFIIECLTDNTNRTISALKGYSSKCGCHLGNPNSVAFNYVYCGVIILKGISEDEALDACIMAEVEPKDLYSEEDLLVVTTEPSEIGTVRDALTAAKEGVEVVSDEVKWLPNDEIEIGEEDIEKVNRFLGFLDGDDDVTNVYHNISNI